ncbi:unnamed protein product [Prorocentrum cordatum]|uniref:Uncharacterized protein n=1 Tax=Prorocentrum cordatum TaxID=2364126 RepID=A0ABN9Y7U1_9DINO|nr:unnamed protein product [Polarella glacialis]
MKSLKVHLEVEGADSEKIAQVFDRVRGRDSAAPMYHTATHPEEFHDDPQALYTVGDIPTMPPEGCKKVKHVFFAVVLNYQGDIDLAAARGAMLVNNYNGLPEPLRPRTGWEALCTMQVALAPSGDGEGTDIIKYFLFSSPQPLVDVESRLLRDGEALCTPSWGKGGGVKTPWKVLVYMMDRLGGTHFRCHLPPQAKGAKEKNTCIPQDVIGSQYQFIKDNAPRGNFDCEQMMRIDFQLGDPQSSVHNWKEGKIKEVLSHIKDQSIQAKKITHHPIFIFDSGVEGVERAKRLVPTFKSHSCLMTPYLETMAFAMADYHADKQGDRSLASHREAPDLDFFRAEGGTKNCPCVFDDGGLFEQRPKTLKAFLDVGQFQATTRERRGAAKFVRGQARFAAENMYDETKKRNQYLFDMLKRTFPKDMSKANVAALLKRSSAVVNTPDDAFERLAGLDSDVTRAPKVGHYITAAAGNILHDYIKNGAMRDAEEHRALRDKQLRFMKALLDKGAAPVPLAVKRELLDDAEGGSGAAASEPLPNLPKRVLWARSFGAMPQGEIDLSTPPDAPPGAAAGPSSQDIAAAFDDADSGDQLGVGGGMDDASD